MRRKTSKCLNIYDIKHMKDIGILLQCLYGSLLSFWQRSVLKVTIVILCLGCVSEFILNFQLCLKIRSGHFFDSFFLASFSESIKADVSWMGFLIFWQLFVWLRTSLNKKCCKHSRFTVSKCCNMLQIKYLCASRCFGIFRRS